MRHALARPGRTPPGRTPSWQVIGRLVHDDVVREPLHHARVEVFVGAGDREELLVRGVADGKGRFALPFTLSPQRMGWTLRLRVLMGRPSLGPEDPPARRWRVAARAMSAPLREPGTVDLGEVEVAWWERRPDGRLLPLPVELRDGDGFPLVDRPPTAALLARVAASPVDGPPVPVGRLLSALPVVGWQGRAEGWWMEVGPGHRWSGRGESVSWDGVGAEQEGVSVLLRAAAVSAWQRCVVEVEPFAVSAFRVLRSSPLADVLLPRLRGVAWTAARVDAALSAGPPGDVGAVKVMEAPSAPVLRGRVAGCPGGRWERVRTEAVEALGQVVARWRAEGWLDPSDREVLLLQRAWGQADVEPALVDVLVRVLVEAPWTTGWLSAALAGGATLGCGEGWDRLARAAWMPLERQAWTADPAADLGPEWKVALTRVADAWGDAPGAPWPSMMP